MKTYIITSVNHDSDWQTPIVLKTKYPEKATEFFHDFILGLIDTLCPAIIKNFGQEPTRKNKTDLFAFINKQPRMEIDNTHCVLYNNNEKVMDATLYDMTYAIENIDDNSPNDPDSDTSISVSDYYKMQHDFYKKDAENHINDLIENCENCPANNDYVEKLKSINDDDLDILAERFSDSHDCNIPDNDQWENIIWKYIGRY